MLYNLTEAITIGASLLYSFMPETAEKILSQLNTKKRTLEEMEQFGLYPSGNKVVEDPEVLFARADIKEIMKKVEVIEEKQRAAAAAAAGAAEKKKEEAPAEAEDTVEIKPEITYDDFAKLQFRVGEIISCEAVKKSKKLLCSQVKIGNEVRQILSGIHQWYEPEQMVGKKVMVLTNLAPRKMAGLESQGMILAAEDASGNLSVMVPEKQEIQAGAEIN